MQNSLLNQLLKINTFSAQLTQILEKISKHFSALYENISTNSRTLRKLGPSQAIRQMEHYLVSLCCQNKNLLHYKYLEHKINNEHCLAHTVDILSYIVKIYQESASSVSSIFLTHVSSHTSCYITYYSYLMLIESCPQLLKEISYQKLSQINSKLQKQQNIYDDIKMLHSIQLNNSEVFNKEHLQICDRNLNNYLLNKLKPHRGSIKNVKPVQEIIVTKPTSIKIPPLALPTSKSINSQRFLTVSKEQKRKGLPEFCKLAANLGQNFITVQLGCLLANKRTRQVQQFSENQTFRHQCFQKIEKIHTQRMNSSRISLIISGSPNNTFEQQHQSKSSEQSSKTYYRRVLEANLNLFLRKALLLEQKTNPTFLQYLSANIKPSKLQSNRKSPKKQNESSFHYIVQCLKQIIDMGIVGIFNLSKKGNSGWQQSEISKGESRKSPGVFSLIMKKMKSSDQVISEIMQKLSLETHRVHKFLLMNRNKNNCSYHYEYEQSWSDNIHGDQPDQVRVETDEFLKNIILKINEAPALRGNHFLFPQKKENEIDFLVQLKKHCDPTLFYFGGYLQSLQQSADMSHPLFYEYQTNILRGLNFYLKSTQANNMSIYYIVQFMTPLLIMLKRELLELSHPYFQSECEQIHSNYSSKLRSETNNAKGARNLLHLSSHTKSPNQNTTPLIFKCPQLMGEYIELLGNILDLNSQGQNSSNITRRSNKYTEKLISNIFIKNIYFMELLQRYVEFVLKEERIQQISKVLIFYRKALEVYNSPSHNSQTNSYKNKHVSSNESNKNIRFIYQHLSRYLEPKTGCIARILCEYEKIISPSVLEDSSYEQSNLVQNITTEEDGGREKQKLHEESTRNMLKIQRILHQVLLFIAQVYYISPTDNHNSQAIAIFEEQVASFYIKYSVMGFIKLYSLLTVTELVNINSSSKTGTKKHDGMDHILSTKESPHSSSQVNTKQIFMLDFLKILTSLSINRTPAIGKKFWQYRVLQFFIREIQLEFSVAQNIQKYIKKAINIFDVPYKQSQKAPDSPKNISSSESEEQKYYERQPKGIKIPSLPLGKVQKINQCGDKQKKISIPILNLTGKLFQKTENSLQDMPNQSIEEKEKDFNKTDKFFGAPSKIKVPHLKKIPTKITDHKNSKEDSFQFLDSQSNNNEKGFLDEILDQIVKPTKKNKRGGSIKSNKKAGKSKELNILKTEQNIHFNLNLNLDNMKAKGKSVQLDPENLPSMTDKSGVLSERSMIYQTQRKIRKIYSNKILHSECILLILSLILQKGQLDPLYCDQMPITRGKLNVLYILHYHLNHESNKSILPILADSVSKIKPYLAGQRLFKLLVSEYTDLGNYHSWSKISAGAYGVVMTAMTHLEEPAEVAIKQMNFPKSIYERCVLHDIFTEITCLEMFRLEDRVTKMFNYGVVENTYVIIMKKYACSVRDWRLNKSDSLECRLFPPTLPNILALFYEVLKGIRLLHTHNVTHYDIKGDNILLDFEISPDPRQPPRPKVVFADFGVCKIYQDQRAELDLKSRGTQCIKSPEMLTLSLKNKKQADNYDRRKKIGTTKASDIWSLGCLLYELVTGDFLFNSNDWVHFFMQVTSINQEILTQAQCQKMSNNIYLIDFMKYMMIRDPQHRPSIHNIITRFENLYALLVSNPERVASNDLRSSCKKNLDDLISDYIQMIESNESIAKTSNVSNERQKSRQKSKKVGAIHKKKHQKTDITEQNFVNQTNKMTVMCNSKASGKIMKIMDDIYFCESQNYLISHQSRVCEQGITHIVVMPQTDKNIINKNKFKVLQIHCHSDEETIRSSVYRLCPKISDFLREVLLLKGKLLFVNNETNYAINLLIYILSFWFRCSVYETWCLINTQILSFPTFNSNPNLKMMSKMLNQLNSIECELEGFPKLQCICGSVTIILKKTFQQKKGLLRPCRCRKKGADGTCLSKNCIEYLQFIKRRYNIAWDSLTWALTNPSDLMIAMRPNDGADILRSSIILNSGHPIENLIWEVESPEGYRVASCRICQMWMISSCGSDSESSRQVGSSKNKKQETWIILNNLIKSCRQSIMIPNAQQEFKSETPALNYFTLSKLHMTSQ